MWTASLVDNLYEMLSCAFSDANFNLSSLQTSTDTLANSADTYEMAHIEPSHQGLPFCYWLLNEIPICKMGFFKFWNGTVISETQGWTG